MITKTKEATQEAVRKAPLLSLLGFGGVAVAGTMLGGTPAVQGFVTAALEPQIVRMQMRSEITHAQNTAICKKLGIEEECEKAQQEIENEFARKLLDENSP